MDFFKRFFVVWLPEGLERRVGEGLGKGWGRAREGLGRGWGGFGFLCFKNPV